MRAGAARGYCSPLRFASAFSPGRPPLRPACGWLLGGGRGHRPFLPRARSVSREGVQGARPRAGAVVWRCIAECGLHAWGVGGVSSLPRGACVPGRAGFSVSGEGKLNEWTGLNFPIFFPGYTLALFGKMISEGAGEVSPVRRRELGWEVGGAPFGSNRWFCKREPAAFAAAMGCRRRPPPPPPPLRVPSALRYSRRVAATVAGGAGGGVARTGLRAPRCLARDLRAWRGGQPGPTALARAARGAKARRAPSWAASPTPASPRRRLSATAPGLERRRSGSGGAAGLREKDAEPRGEALGPT